MRHGKKQGGPGPRRILGGGGRGRRLAEPVPGATRPTSARVRQAIFDILGTRVLEADFLDAYAGTGAVGIEALSRGARRVVFIENDPDAVRAIGVSLAAWPAGTVELIAGDVGRALERLEENGTRFTIAFLDPPYGDPGLALALERAAGLVAPGGILVIEHRRADRLEAPAAIRVVGGRTYDHGDTALTTFILPGPDGR